MGRRHRPAMGGIGTVVLSSDRQEPFLLGVQPPSSGRRPAILSSPREIVVPALPRPIFSASLVHDVSCQAHRSGQERWPPVEWEEPPECPQEAVGNAQVLYAALEVIEPTTLPSSSTTPVKTLVGRGASWSWDSSRSNLAAPSIRTNSTFKNGQRSNGGRCGKCKSQSPSSGVPTNGQFGTGASVRTATSSPIMGEANSVPLRTRAPGRHHLRLTETMPVSRRVSAPKCQIQYRYCSGLNGPSGLTPI